MLKHSQFILYVSEKVCNKQENRNLSYFLPSHKFPFLTSKVPINILYGKKKKKKEGLAAKLKLEAVPCQLVSFLSAGCETCLNKSYNWGEGVQSVLLRRNGQQQKIKTKKKKKFFCCCKDKNKSAIFNYQCQKQWKLYFSCCRIMYWLHYVYVQPVEEQLK